MNEKEEKEIENQIYQEHHKGQPKDEDVSPIMQKGVSYDGVKKNRKNFSFVKCAQLGTLDKFGYEGIDEFSEDDLAKLIQIEQLNKTYKISQHTTFFTAIQIAALVLGLIFAAALT